MLLLIAVQLAQNQNLADISLTGHTSTTPWTSFGVELVEDGSYQKWAFWKIADAGDVADSAAGSLAWTLACTSGFIENWSIAGWSGVNTSTPFAAGPSIEI